MALGSRAIGTASSRSPVTTHQRRLQGQHRGSGTSQQQLVRQVACSSSRNGNWKAFGPTTEYSDGDAEYFQTTSRLSQQYEWFAPQQQQEEERPVADEHDENSPLYGLTPKQISALGLAGSVSGLPDPVIIVVAHSHKSAASVCDTTDTQPAVLSPRRKHCLPVSTYEETNSPRLTSGTTPWGWRGQ